MPGKGKKPSLPQSIPQENRAVTKPLTAGQTHATDASLNTFLSFLM